MEFGNSRVAVHTDVIQRVRSAKPKMRKEKNDFYSITHDNVLMNVGLSTLKVVNQFLFFSLINLIYCPIYKKI